MPTCRVTSRTSHKMSSLTQISYSQVTVRQMRPCFEPDGCMSKMQV